MPTATTTTLISIRAAPGGRGPPPLPANCSVGLSAARSCRQPKPTFSRRVGGEGRGGEEGPLQGPPERWRPRRRWRTCPGRWTRPSTGWTCSTCAPARSGPSSAAPRAATGPAAARSSRFVRGRPPGPARPLTPSPHLRRRQACLQRCTEPVLKGERAVTAGMGRMQEHLARCTGRCEDLARQALPAGAGESQIARAQAQLEACVAKCAAEQVGQVRPPPLAARRSRQRHHTGRGHY